MSCTRCLRKKNSAAYYRYFENGSTQECNIFRLNKYNLYLVVCVISTPYRRWAGKTSHVRLAPEYVFATKHPRRTE